MARELRCAEHSESTSDHCVFCKIERLQKRADTLYRVGRMVENRYLPCPDHRDKHSTGDECLMCQRDRLRNALEQISDTTAAGYDGPSPVSLARTALQTKDAARLPGESQKHANERIAWEKYGPLPEKGSGH